MPPLEGQEEPLRRLAKLVNSFMSRPDTGPFLEPVDWRGLELFDYPEIVTKMMDLGTIKRKLERKQYNTAKECANDIKLVWSNCMAYNAEGSELFMIAKQMNRKFEDKFRRIQQECKWKTRDKSIAIVTAAGKYLRNRSSHPCFVPKYLPPLFMSFPWFFFSI